MKTAMQHAPKEPLDVATARPPAERAEYSPPAPDADGHGSPVHALQARLEESVFASFSAKENPEARGKGGVRTPLIVVTAALAGWGVLMAGAALNFY